MVNMINKIGKSKVISVLDLAQFLFPSGNLSFTSTSSERLREGASLHRAFQAENEAMSEVSLSKTIPIKGYFITLHGRADQILAQEHEVIIREIKTTFLAQNQLSIDTFPSHWLQAVAYAFLYIDSPLEDGSINLELCYIHLPGKEVTRFKKSFTHEKIFELAYGMLESYIAWQKKADDWIMLRNKSLQCSSFPFKGIRKGQKEVMEKVSECFQFSTSLWVEAPTGIGKTMAVLYPALQGLKDGCFEKIFYLTSKTSQQIHVNEAINVLSSKGIKLRSIHLTAKEKICSNQEGKCQPHQCPFAIKYYERQREGLEELLKMECFNSMDAFVIAQQFRLCPFEFLLDASVWADIIIGDYNYYFDPRVQLKRYLNHPHFQAVVLVDEAHNLIDRARSMYSSILFKKKIWRIMKSSRSKEPSVHEALKPLHAWFRNEEKESLVFSPQGYPLEHFPETLEIMLEDAQQAYLEIIKKNPDHIWSSESMELYYEISFMLRLIQRFDQRYFTFIGQTKQDVFLKIFCMDPSIELRESFDKSASKVLFSATLSPLPYYKDSLGGSLEEDEYKASSPFPRENLLTLLDASVSTRWKDRKSSLKDVKQLILTATLAKKGNYMVYFPSYQYMQDLVRLIEENDSLRIIMQQAKMNEKEKKDFIDAFQEERSSTLIAMAVLGGSFSEGIDLVGEKLHGVIIVGVGHPSICMERELIKKYYDEQNGKGYAYAYLYPGVNKVVQAGGRVIRSLSDKGFILLIDDRFAQSNYHQLLPDHWKPLHLLKNCEDLHDQLVSFWQTGGRGC